MRYEFPHFTIDYRNWSKGSNSYEYLPDGEFPPSQTSYNAFSSPGFLTISPTLGSTVTGSLPVGIGLSWAQGLAPGNFSPDMMVVGNNSSQDGTFWTMIESTGALTQVGAADTGRDYVLGKTDTVYYKGSFYTSSTTDLCKNSVDLVTRDVTWWIGTKAQTGLNSAAPHPMVVFGDIMYIADGRYLHQNDNGTPQYNVFDLGSDWVISALAVYNNLIYIAAEPYYNFSGTYAGGAKIFTWNGYSNSWLNEYPIDQRVNAMYVFKNVLYVWTPSTIGYFTGTTIDPLYPVNNKVTWSQITATSDSMWYADGTHVVRYGSPSLRGKKSFFRFWENSAVSSHNGIVSPQRDSMLMFTTTVSNGGNYFVSSVNGIPTLGWTFKMNTRMFGRPVRIRGYVFHTQGLDAGYVQMSYYNDKGQFVGTKRFTSADATMIHKYAWRFDVLGQDPTESFMPYLDISGAAYIRAIDVLYEPSEVKQNA